MERRTLLKGFCTLPFAGSVMSNALASKQANSTAPTTLIIYLEGPFGIVLHTKNRDRIQIFTPMDHSHVFFCNGSQENHLQVHNIQLIGQECLVSNSNPDLSDRNIEPFHWNSTMDNASHNDVIVMDLPSPDAITTYESGMVSAEGIFKSRRTAFIPSAHALQYTIKNCQSFKLHDGIMKDKDAKVDDLGQLFFLLQKGLEVKEKEPDPDGTLARDFHNGQMLPRFSDIADDTDKQFDSIKEIDAKSKRVACFRANKLPSKVQPMVSTAVECKASGFLITTNP